MRLLPTMKEENDFPKPFLLDEEANEFKLVSISSYLKKIWGFLLQQSTMLWHNIKSGIKNTVSCIFRKYPVNLPFIKILKIFILVFLLFSLVSILLLLKEKGIGKIYPFGNNVATSVVLVKGDNTETIPKDLTATVLLEAKESEPFCEAMKNCFDTAVNKFESEPRIVKENAKMILKCNGTRKEFVSGKGENYIEVFWVDGQTYYTVKEANSQVYAARLGRQPLNLGSLLKVYQQLVSLEGSEELQQCLNKTIEKFPKEPHAVQDNAVLQVSCGESNVTFHSGAGENEINVYKVMQGEIVFNVKAKGWAWWARLFRRN
ncbi:uncharacterized protein LOC113424982 isoform X1 [Notechis scutatus]|uniref:Uncharacterized protein LOC113424982 isoform X1 n=2 Tax=Notechis scutatus TaxID=8663 RepID=A0A6J1VI08_9SAUR|nr:uncharacterized protein LOC113424982 isoform X1 [Notechis scutatus]